MDSKQKKMIFAIVLLVIAGLVAAYNFGLFSPAPPKPGSSDEPPRRMPRGPNPDEPAAPSAPAK